MGLRIRICLILDARTLDCLSRSFGLVICARYNSQLSLSTVGSQQYFVRDRKLSEIVVDYGGGKIPSQENSYSKRVGVRSGRSRNKDSVNLQP